MVFSVDIGSPSFQKAPTDPGPATPPSPVAEAISNAVGVVGDVQEFRAKKKIEDVVETAEVVKTVQAGGVTFNQDLQPVTADGTPANLDEELAKRVEQVKNDNKATFQTISAALDQGATFESAATLQAETELRRLINQTPGFSKELRAVARETLGFDPLGFGLERLFGKSTDKDTRSAFQKERDFLVESHRAAGLPLTDKEAASLIANQKRSELVSDTADDNLKLQNIGFNSWLGAKLQSNAPNLAQLNTALQIELQDTGFVDAQKAQEALNQIKIDLTKQLRDDATAGKQLVTQETLNEITTGVNNLYAPLEAAIKNTDVLNVWERATNKITSWQILQANAQNNPLQKLLFINNVFGTNATSVIDMFANIQDPFTRDRIIEANPFISQSIKGFSIAEQDVPTLMYSLFENTVQGAAPASPEEAQLQPQMENSVLENNDPEVTEKYIQGLFEAGSSDRAVDMLTDKRSIRNMTEATRAQGRRQYRIAPTVTKRLAATIESSPMDAGRELVFERNQFGLSRSAAEIGSKRNLQAPPKQTNETRFLNTLYKGLNNGFDSVIGVDKQSWVLEILNDYQKTAEEASARLQESQNIDLTFDPATGEVQ